MLRLSFKDVRTLTTSDHQPIRGFELLDADGLIYSVTAEAFGDVVRIPIPKSIRSQRLTIRYGWNRLRMPIWSEILGFLSLLL